MKALFAVVMCLAVVSSINVMDIFNDVGDDDYAKSLIVNIQIQLDSGANVDTLIDGLRGVDDNLKQQLADGEAHHNAQRQACADDMAELNAGLTQAEADLHKLDELFSMDQNTLDSRRAELANRRDELAARQAMGESLDAQRAAEQERFNAVVAEHEGVFVVLAEVRDIINRNFGGDAEFLQTGSTMKSSLVSKLTSFHTQDKGMAHGYNAFFKLLAQLVAKTDEVHVDTTITNNILAIVDRIEENLEMSLASERDAERERQADYEELSAKVAGQVNAVTSNIVDLEQVCATLENRIHQQTTAHQAAQQAAADYTTRIGDRQASCNAEQAQWENFYNNITSELQTAANVLYQLTDKHNLLARYGL